MNRYIELDIELDDVCDFFSDWYMEVNAEIPHRRTLSGLLRKSKKMLLNLEAFDNPSTVEQVYHNEMRRRFGELRINTESLLNPQKVIKLSDLRYNEHIDFSRIVRQIEVRYGKAIDDISMLSPVETGCDEVRLPSVEEKRRFYDLFCSYYSNIAKLLSKEVRDDYLSVAVEIVESSVDEGSCFNRTANLVGICIDDI